MKNTREKTKKDNFNKKAGTFMYDNKQDEMLMNVLDLYPNKVCYIFMGDNGKKKKSELLKKVRKSFDSLQKNEQYANALGDGKLREKFRGAFQKIGRGVKTAALAPARGAAIGLIKLNYRGNATRFNLLNEQGRKKLFDKWEDLGGNIASLKNAISIGEKKKPLICGKKCRARAGVNPPLPSEAQSDFVNAVETATAAALISAGGGVIATTVKVVGDRKNFKDQMALMKLDADIAQEQAKEDASDAAMSPQERKIADEIIKAQEAGSDPIAAIQNNPNLTAEEKAAAIQQIQQSLGTDTKRNVVIIGLAVVAIGSIIYFFSKKSSQ